jgi:hypothetical protein
MNHHKASLNSAGGNSALVDPILIDRLIDLLNEALFPTGRIVLKASEAVNYIPQSTELRQ